MRRWLIAMVCAAALSATWPNRMAYAKTVDSESPSPEKTKKSKSDKKAGKGKNGSMKLTAPGGSGESPAERSVRLRRECKGRPNAGACSGYTD